MKDFAKTTTFPSTLENIDFSVFEWIDRDLNIQVMTNTGQRKVPILFAPLERAFMSKQGKEMRDNYGTLIFPLISISRGDIKKPDAHRGNMGVNIWPNPDSKQGSIAITRKINQDKTRDNANALSFNRTGQINFPRKNNTVIYETWYIPQPVNVEIPYSVTIVTEYRQQSNTILASFINRLGNINSFYLERNGHRYEAFVSEDYSTDDNADQQDNERQFKTTLTLTVLGHLIGEEDNQRTPHVIKRENAPKIAFKEYIVSGTERKPRNLIPKIIQPIPSSGIYYFNGSYQMLQY